jgi:hypothetical protein
VSLAAWAGVVLEEGQRDRAVEGGEELRGSGPDAVEFGAQLVGQRDARMDEVLMGAGERAQRARGVAVRLERAEAMAVGAREFGEHERVEAVALAARVGVARPRRLDLVGMDRHHDQSGLQQPVDQQPVGPLERDPLDGVLAEQRDQRAQPAFVMADRAAHERAAVLVDDADGVVVFGPVDPGKCAHRWSSSVEVASSRVEQEVPLRALIGRRSIAQRPVAALGASHPREALVSQWPSQRQATLALSRRCSTLLAGQSQASPDLRPGSHPLNPPTSENNLPATPEDAQ